MDVLHTDSRPLINFIILHLKAPHLVYMWLQGCQISRERLYLVQGGDTSGLCVKSFTYLLQVFAGFFYRVEIHLHTERLAPDILHATFHMSFFPSGTCVAKAEIKPVKGAHTAQSLRGSLICPFEVLARHSHLVIYHDIGNSLHLAEEITV